MAERWQIGVQVKGRNIELKCIAVCEAVLVKGSALSLELIQRKTSEHLQTPVVTEDIVKPHSIVVDVYETLTGVLCLTCEYRHPYTSRAWGLDELESISDKHNNQVAALAASNKEN